MITQKTRNNLRIVRARRVRAVVVGSTQRPRLSVFRSNYALSAQVIDDTKGITLFACRTLGKNRQHAIDLGTQIVKKAKQKKIEKMVFDRSGYRYHGTIKSFVDAVREGGIVI